MADDPIPVEITPSCNYECNGEKYVLVGGNAPEGYYCPEVLGPCNQGDLGEVLTGFPVLTPVPIPVVDPPAIDP